MFFGRVLGVGEGSRVIDGLMGISCVVGIEVIVSFGNYFLKLKSIKVVGVYRIEDIFFFVGFSGFYNFAVCLFLFIL